MLNGWKILVFPSKVRSSACDAAPHLSCVSALCRLSAALTALLFPDRTMNGDTSPEEKKQEVEGEKLSEETSVGENHRYTLQSPHFVV